MTGGAVNHDGLPDWAVVSPARRAHVERVVALLDDWAVRCRLTAAERRRWARAGWLHDALRDAPEATLRQLSDWPDAPAALLHGPAAARRAIAAGETDDELLEAVTYHTVGCAAWRDLGLALYAADFLEPGRPFDQAARAELAARFPAERDDVIREILRRRMAHLERTGHPARPETVAFAAAWLA